MTPSRPIDQATLDALSAQRAFGLLDAEARAACAAAAQLLQVPRGDLQVASDALYLVVSGRVSLRDADSGASVVLCAGELFGYGCPARALDPWAVRADDDDVHLLRFGSTDVDALCAAYPPLGCFVTPAGTRAAAGARTTDPHLNLMTMPVRALIRRAPITLAPSTSIRDAAEKMCEQRVSSVLIVESGRLFGLVTDRDLRNRALARGIDISRPVIDIATVAPLTMDVRKPAFDALLLMARHNIHHVPVMDGDTVVGMITATDLTEQHSTSAVYLAGDIYKQDTVDGLAAGAARVRALQQNLAAAGASAYSTGHIITAITDAITCRLLQLAEARFGPAPIDYVWVAAGSQARSEQTAKSDQDNCLILDDSYDAARHGEYFKSLSTLVCDGLDACGYIHCPGDMMAMTDQWRQPRSRWAQYFRNWTEEPEPKALMLTCVFFDLRAIYGKTSLLEDLRRDVLARTRDNRIFLAYMVSNALSHQPPLGLFRTLSTIRSGEHRGRIDLKHNGIVPIVDLARVYALAGGHDAVNTHDRLASAADSKEISEQSARDLRDALEFIAALRIQHQARQLGAGQDADNFLRPDELSNFERSQLKDAFTVVQTLQSVLGQRYQAGRF
ncbi:MAG: CBS domain-containing protein [Gammaproteobacteria bacterium]|jgi:CBS domain-containing protein|nr:CBS domain-containing protein [Gammaproteobacteria bacterium]MBU0771370.1 CBS domain-containing protein [Gammaproteobacteria bacterium]MBU0857114.1 CBS domain-containing protein [Gammaproteobacteria bacterium]MBU1847992.1 CBS domain-containing protein [Gammaproteobacteria bacterium]